MSPQFEPVVIQGDKYTIRHVGPSAKVWADALASPVTVLNNSTMVARPLPISQQPDSPDFAYGSWTGRLGDSGESSLVFPNREASDGVPWRQRFDPTGHLQWVEVWYDGELDFCGVIDKVPTIDEQQVQIHLADGWWLLNKAYERDWIVTQSPRDVIQRGTQVWVPLLVDGFPPTEASPGSTGSQWTSNQNPPSTTSVIQPGGGCELGIPFGANNVTISAVPAALAIGDVWRVVVSASNVNGLWSESGLVVTLTGDSGYTYAITLSATTAALTAELTIQPPSAATQQVQQSLLPGATGITLMLECDGEWIWAFANGQIAACIRNPVSETSFTGLSIELTSIDNPLTATINSVLFEAQAPFLMAGPDQGDFVLPGSMSTYPYGGLHARYFNDLDIQAQASGSPPLALSRVLAPSRTQAYAGSNPAEYMNQLDPQIFSQIPPSFTAQAAGEGPSDLAGWSCVWFGAIYLKLSQGSYTFTTVQYGSGSIKTALRLWVGNLQFGEQIIDTWSSYGTPGTKTGTVSGAAQPASPAANTVYLGGTLPYNGGTIARDGWYPIKLEYSVSAAGSAGNAPELKFTPPNPSGEGTYYVDPGGSQIDWNTITADGIPSTSLSPLGCVDQRYQGVSHFAMVQQTVQAFGYQATIQPEQLESGLFPGVLAPRVYQGIETDIILSPDDTSRTAGEGLLNYSSGLDATDYCSELWGNGAGFQNGNTGQLQSVVFDPTTLESALFAVQQWQDFSDASFGPLLAALLNSQIELQLAPWQLLSADPKGRPRKAYQWPLPSSIANMRWRAGDAMLIRAIPLNVWDTVPRQMLTFTRNMLPLGIASSQAQFAERPRTEARTLKQQLYKATRQSRNYQRQRVTLTGTYQSVSVAGSGGISSVSSLVSLLPNDTVISAVLRITGNSDVQALGLNVRINGTDETSGLGGPWSAVPATIDVTSYAASASDASGALYVFIKNNGSSATTVTWQLLVDVLR